MVDGEDGVTMAGVFGPLTKLHAPVPIVGVLAAIVAEPVATQMFCLGPAFEIVALSYTVIITLSLFAGQTLFVIVHANTYTPGTRLCIVVEGEVLLVNEEPAGPLMYDHVPVPTEGVFPASVITESWQEN